MGGRGRSERRARGADGVLLCARVARVMGRRKRHDILSLSWKKFFFFWRALFCVSLHRCGDAPIPAVLVSSPLPFDDQHTLSHGFMATRTDTLTETVKKSLLHRFGVCAAFL